MKQKIVAAVVQGMLPYLNNAQTEKLQEVLLHTLWDYDISVSDGKAERQEQDLLSLFLAAKRIEGCSEKSLKYYQATTQAMLDGIGKPIKEIVTEDIRQYLTNYQRERHSSRVTIDNIRRILSSFFSWLEDEDYILKSPVRRIHKVKTASNIKETYSDETLELMRDSCSEMRDLAMIDLLASTGMRVREMVLLNRDDVDFAERECVVFGKGDKERMVYFDARTKLHLQTYLDSRNDNNPALIVSLKAPFSRLSIGGVETRLRELGRQLGVHKVHPHKFRRTLATMAIDKGMPIEQLQQLLGHKRIDTAFYAKSISDKVDLKWAYYKFLTYDINRMDSGSAIPSTDRYEIYSIDVDLPDLVTQRRVVSVLELLDNKIQDNNKINDNLAVLKFDGGYIQFAGHQFGQKRIPQHR